MLKMKKIISKIMVIAILFTGCIVPDYNDLSIAMAKPVNIEEYIVDGKVLVKYMGGDNVLTIPDNLGITKIDSKAFINRTTLISITLPNGLTDIGSQAFDGCIGLKSITLPSGLLRIGEYAFSNCKSLKTISIPQSVESIAANSFSECSDLTIYVYVNSYAESYAKEQGIPFVSEIVATPTPGPSNTPEITKEPSPTPSITEEPTLTPNVTTVPSESPMVTENPMPSAEVSPSVTPEITTIPTPSAVVSPSITPRSTEIPTASAVVSSSAIPEVSLVPTASAVVSEMPTASAVLIPSIAPKQSQVPVTAASISIKKAKISLAKSSYYTAYRKKVIPKVKVEYNKKTLVLGKDYSISYKNNKKYGKATVLVKGKGVYTGKCKASFYILPQRATISKYKIYSYKSGRAAKLNWKKQKGVFGYEILYAKSKKGKYKLATRKDTNITSTNLSFSEKKVYIKMRAYILIDGKYKYGKYSKVKQVRIH